MLYSPTTLLLFDSWHLLAVAGRGPQTIVLKLLLLIVFFFFKKTIVQASNGLMDSELDPCLKCLRTHGLSNEIKEVCISNTAKGPMGHEDKTQCLIQRDIVQG